MPEFFVTDRAQADLDSIWNYIASDNPDAADRVEDSIVEAFSKLAEHPFMGHKREDLTGKDLRFWGVYFYLIIYDPHAEPPIILRVLSGWRDVAEAMG